jgi:SET domain-containing protein
MTQGIQLPFYIDTSPTLGIRGLLASQEIKKGSVIETCPTIIYKKNTPVIEQTVFDHYVFDWDENHEAMALGYGALYNHSETPNVEFDFDTEKKTIIFAALRDIAKGEELMINYDSETDEPIDPGYLSFDKDIEN